MAKKRQLTTHHVWSSNFDDASITSPQSRLTSDHVSAIAEHQHTHEGIGILVPAYDRLIVLPRTTRDTFILCKQFLLVLDLSSLLLSLLFGLDGEVDVS